MSPFWRYARRMLDQRLPLAMALVMAFISAGGLGAGLLGLVGVLKQLLPAGGAEQQSLRSLARDAAANLPPFIAPPASWIDALPEGRFEGLLLMVLALGLLTVIGASANFLHGYLSLTIATRTVAKLREEAFAHVLSLPLGHIVANRASDLISRIVNDTNVLNRGFQGLTSKAVAQTTKGAASFCAAFYLNWKLSIVTLLVAPLLYVIIRKLGKRIRRASRGAMQSQGKLLAKATEALLGFRVVKVYGAEKHEADRFTAVNRQVLSDQLRARTAKAMSGPLMEVISILAIGGLALIAAKAIIDQKLDPAVFIGALAALAVAGNSLKPLSGVIQDIHVADAAADRLHGLMNTAPESSLQRGSKKLPRHTSELQFEEVTFTYPNAPQPALRGVNLRVSFGETVAIVGPNGSGKTTLLSLAARLYAPDSGRVLIDGIDLAEVDLSTLRAQIGVVTQEVVLFHGTVRDNILYSRPAAQPAEIERAIRSAHAEDFISRLPHGLDTIVGDQGLMLSGGQRQRLSIARALLNDPAILMMDEATSMVDAESEAQIARAIAELSHSRTCLIVAHRLSTVINADRIVVIDRGRIIDVGRHDELMERCAAYRQIAERQLQPIVSASST